MVWRYATARSTGAYHVTMGTPCQDSLACSSDPPENLLIAISDGAGSAPLADVGSALAVSTASALLKNHILRPQIEWPLALETAARNVQGALLLEAAQRQVPIAHFACTLLLLVLTPDGGAALQIGDGVMALRSGADPWRYIFWPQKGEFVNSTHFITDVDAENTWAMTTLGTDVQEVAAMTDGLESLALQFATQSVHNGFFDGVMRPLTAWRGDGEVAEVSASLDEFLHSPRVTGRTDDDLTLVIASRSTQR